MKSNSALEKFLALCEQAHPANGHSVNAQGSIVVESESMVESPSIYDQAICSTSTNESLEKHLQAEIEGSIPPSRCEEEAVAYSSESNSNSGFNQTPLAHSTPHPCDEKVGFWINPDEISEDLKQDTVALAMKYFFR